MTLLIKNVRIIGGAQAFPEISDIFVSGDKISAIGNFSSKTADQIVDGQGAYLSPGFIDTNNDSDHYLSIFDHPEQEDFVRQGVTTIIGGTCGSSLAPLIYGSLESVRKWGDTSKINIDWAGVEEFLSLFDKKPLSVNFATLIGHSTIRRAILGEEIRDLTKNELGVFAEILKRGLNEGAFGLSSGLGYVHSAKTPYSEIKLLASIVKENNGVYATHLRKSGSEILESIDETIKLATETGVKTQISHFVPIRGFEKEYELALEKIEGLPKEIDFHFDIYPSDTLMFPLYTFLPDWAKTGGAEVMYANLEDEWKQSRILKDLPEINPADFTLAQAPGNEFLVGRSLQDLSAIYNTSNHKETIIKLMIATRLRGVVFYKNINYDLVKRALGSSRSLVASNAASYPYSGKMLKSERAVSSFPKFLETMVRSKTITIEEAINKITVEAAQKFNLEKRGVVSEGNFADLVIFSIDENAQAAVRAVDIKTTIVNGEVVLRDGIYKNKFPGKALRHVSK